MSLNRDFVFKIVKFSFMLILGIIITINPNSLLSILLVVTGVYLCITGFNSLISTLSLIKYRRGWVYESIKTVLMLVVGMVLLFNSPQIAKLIYGVVSVIIGIVLTFIGIMAIVRTRESSSGVFFIIIGLLIALFPLGFSYLIIRGIGVSLIILASYLLYSMKFKSS